jgi:hypothetical protein
VLDLFQRFGPQAPIEVLRMWRAQHQANFVYATVALVIAGALGLGLIGGYVYLVMEGHATAGGVLLGSGALSMVAGFRTVRLHRDR